MTPKSQMPLSYTQWMKKCLADYRAPSAIGPVAESEVGASGKIPAAYLTRALREDSAKILQSRGYLSSVGYTFDGDLHLEGMAVPFAVFLMRCRFLGDIHMWRMKAKTLSFNGSIFELGADFRSTSLEGHLLMRGLSVSGPLIVRDMVISGAADFSGSDFRFDGSGTSSLINAASNEAVGFSRSTAQMLYWRNLRKKPRAVVNFRDAYVKTFMHDLDQDPELRSWPRQSLVVLDGFRYDRIEQCEPERAIRWIKLQPQFVASAYAALAQAYANLRLDQSAQEVMIAFKQEEISRFPSAVKKAFYRGVFFAVGYGQRPGRALLILTILFLLHVAISTTIWRFNLMEPSSDKLAFDPCYYTQGPKCKNSALPWRGIKLQDEVRYVPADYPEFSEPEFSARAFAPFIFRSADASWDPRQGVVRIVLSILSATGMLMAGLFFGSLSGLLSPKIKLLRE